MTGKALRLKRLFEQGKSVIVPMDHAIFFGPIPALRDPNIWVSEVAQSEANAILMTLGCLNRVATVMGRQGVIARIDGTVTRLGPSLEVTDQIASVEQAVSAGADAVVLNVYIGVDSEREMLGKLGRVSEACWRWGVPLVAEMIPGAALARHYAVDAPATERAVLAEHVAVAARVGAEMGADVIKTCYTGSVESFAYVVDNAMVPVWAAGGPVSSGVEGVIQMVDEVMHSGAAGVCIGRNVWEREKRLELLHAICQMVHHGLSAAEARTLIGEV